MKRETRWGSWKQRSSPDNDNEWMCVAQEAPAKMPAYGKILEGGVKNTLADLLELFCLFNLF